MKKYLVLALVLVLAISVGLVGCKSKDATTGDAGSSDKIIIGGTLCTTGFQAPLDEPALEGVRVAVKEINANGGILGKQVEFINIDGKSDAVAGGEAAKQLLAKGAEVFIPASDYTLGQQTLIEAQKAGKVAVSPCGSSILFDTRENMVDGKIGDKIFTLSMWNSTMGSAIAEYAYNELGAKKVYVITDDLIEYTKDLSACFVARFKELGGEVLADDAFAGDQGSDPAPYLAKYKALPTAADAIYISSYMPDLAGLVQVFREAGVTVPILGGDSYDDPAFFETLGPKLANDIYYDTHSYLDEKYVPGYEAYAAAYKAETKKDLDAPWSMAGYDVVMVFKDAIERAGTTEGDALAKAMVNTEYKLLTGNLTWSDAESGHEPTKAAFIVKLDKAAPTPIGWVTPIKNAFPTK